MKNYKDFLVKFLAKKEIEIQAEKMRKKGKNRGRGI